MSSPYEMFETDKQVEKQGIYINYGDFKIKVARAGGSNTAFTKMMEHETKPYRRQLQNGMIDTKVLDDILRRVYAKTVILGWENVANKKGDYIDFNYENCVQLFIDLPELFNDIRDQAANFELFKKEILEDESKNLESSSGIK